MFLWYIGNRARFQAVPASTSRTSIDNESPGTLNKFLVFHHLATSHEGITSIFQTIPRRFLGFSANEVTPVRLCVLSFSRRYRAAIYHWSHGLFVLPYNNSRSSERIFIKFGMRVTPVDDASRVLSVSVSYGRCWDALALRKSYVQVDFYLPCCRAGAEWGGSGASAATLRAVADGAHRSVPGDVHRTHCRRKHPRTARLHRGPNNPAA